MSENNIQYCVVRSASEWYALPSGLVREVMLCPELTRVPNTSPMLKGISHVNNEFLTITAPLTGGIESDESLAAEETVRQLLVLSGPDGPWGFLVDEVVELTSLDDFQPQHGSDRHLSFLGIATYEGNNLSVLDVDETYRNVISELKSHWQKGFRNFDLAQEA